MTVAALRRFAGDRKGNVAIIFAFSLMPLMMLTGMGIDYTMATQRKAELDAAADAAVARAEKVAEFRAKFANPYIAVARGFIDEVIQPRETRRKLITALKNLENKRDKNPPKKHGNIPL